MQQSFTDTPIGIVGTVLYLYVWHRLMQAFDPEADGLDEVQRQRRIWRRRIWQIVLFLGLTPYVLLLFYLMEKARGW